MQNVLFLTFVSMDFKSHSRLRSCATKDNHYANARNSTRCYEVGFATSIG